MNWAVKFWQIKMMKNGRMEEGKMKMGFCVKKWLNGPEGKWLIEQRKNTSYLLFFGTQIAIKHPFFRSARNQSDMEEWSPHFPFG